MKTTGDKDIMFALALIAFGVPLIIHAAWILFK